MGAILPLTNMDAPLTRLHTLQACRLQHKRFIQLSNFRVVKATYTRLHPATGVTGRIAGLAQTERSAFEIVKYLLNNAFIRQPLVNKGIVVASLGALVASKLLNVQVPQIFKNAVNQFSDYAQGRVKIDGASSEQQKEALMWTTIAVAAMGSIVMFGLVRLSAEFLDQLRNALFATVSQNTIRRLSVQLFSKIHNMPMSWHLGKQTGMVVKAIDRGTRGSHQLLKATAFNIAPTIFELALVSHILHSQCGGQFSAIAMGTAGGYAAFTIGVTRWRTPFRVQMNRADNQAGNLAVDSLTNFETVKLFNNEKFEADRYDVQLRKYENASLKVEWSLAGLNFGQQAIITGGMTWLMYESGKGIIDGTMTVGDLVMVNGLLFNLSRPLGFLGSVWRDMNQSLTDMKTMLAIMDTPVLKDHPDCIDATKIIPTPQHQPVIEFRNVAFKYDNNHSIFEDLSFTIPAGKKVAIVGGSGSGKSTVVRLLYRFYQPDAGQILVDGHRIDRITADSFRKTISVVPQDCVLFHDTIEHNIKYGAMETATDEDMIWAAKQADFHDSVMKMKDGYETKVGERGLKLSGGEKQRLAIARAILKRPNIVVYDEATSSLDSITETNILDALRTVTQDKTTIVIAHRLSTIMDCDEIIVLGDGGVVQQGAHADLVVMEGSPYWKLWTSQFAAK